MNELKETNMTTQAPPKVTVLMPVYNGEKYMRAAMNSILHQDFRDFEFLIILDPSTDKSELIIHTYHDPRIRLIKNDHRLGLVACLNLGLDSARGQYIARMDCDDVSHWKRLMKQVRFMDTHPDVGVCGTMARYLQSSLKARLLSLLPTILILPQDHEAIKCQLIFSNAVFHPSVMVRKSVLDENRLRYDSSWKYVEDYEFWVRMIDTVKFANLPDYLLYYRLHSEKVSVIEKTPQRQNVLKLMKQIIQKLGIFPSPEELQLQFEIAFMLIKNEKKWLGSVEKWLLKLKRFNQRVGFFAIHEFNILHAKMWATICGLVRCQRFWTWKTFWRSQLHPVKNLRILDKIIFIFNWFRHIFL